MNFKKSRIVVSLALCILWVFPAFAVTSKVVRQSGMADFDKGKTKDVIINSQGTLELGPSSNLLADNLPDSWTVNTIVAGPDGELYLGTSPNGAIFKYAGGAITKIYPIDANSKSACEPKKSEERNNGADEQYLVNEHVFALAMDGGDRLLAGVSGDKARLLRFDKNGCRQVFEPNDTKYIFAIALDKAGNIYLGTGPKGKIYRLNSFGSKPETIYESNDKNILSLAVGEDGFIYAGGDERGLVYRIDPEKKTASVLYDARESDIVSLVLDSSGNIYAAASSTTPAKTPAGPMEPASGKPEIKIEAGKKAPPGPMVQLQIANTETKSSEEEQSKFKTLLKRVSKPNQASRVYKITKDGFVTDILQESAVFFGMAQKDNHLLLATGPDAELVDTDPQSEQRQVLYQDEHASQISAVMVHGDSVYIGAANPAKLIKLSNSLAKEGTYTSELIDAGQPAKWGKLQLEADIPAGTQIKVCARSGNVSDANDSTYSAWTTPQTVKKPVQLDVPQGRFCQYKLILNGDGKVTPIVHEIAVPYMVPNIAPHVESVNVSRLEVADKHGEKQGLFKISYKATDRNSDTLIYSIDIRRLGRENWIKIKDDVEADSFNWDSKTVEDGRYEIRVTASDIRSNTTATALEDSRISDPVVVDNTPPTIKSPELQVAKNAATLKFTAVDALSAIGSVDYTVDSNEDWNGTLPDDLVYDTTSEDFTIVVNKLEPGRHVLAVKVADAVGNTVYKTFEIEIK